MEGFDLFERMAESESGRRVLSMYEDMQRQMAGAARQSQWHCEDGWIIVYTTSRTVGGPHDGKFVTQAFKPQGKGARSGNPERWVETYRRQFSTRKSARARALVLFKQHSPKWAAKHPGVK